MKNSKKLVALAIGVVCAGGFLVGCEDPKIKDLESQVSSLETTNKNLTDENTTLNSRVSDLSSELTNVTYQMFCSVMSQLPMCDLDTKIEYEANSYDSIYNNYASFLTKANYFSTVWNNVLKSSINLEMGKYYKLVYGDSSFDVVQFAYQNGHYNAYVYSDKLFSYSANDDATQARRIYHKTCLILDMTYENGNFKSITMSDYLWERSYDGNGSVVTSSTLKDNESVDIVFDSTKDALSERWKKSAGGANATNKETAVNNALDPSKTNYVVIDFSET